MIKEKKNQPVGDRSTTKLIIYEVHFTTRHRVHVHCFIYNLCKIKHASCYINFNLSQYIKNNFDTVALMDQLSYFGTYCSNKFIKIWPGHHLSLECSEPLKCR